MPTAEIAKSVGRQAQHERHRLRWAISGSTLSATKVVESRKPADPRHRRGIAFATCGALTCGVFFAVAGGGVSLLFPDQPIPHLPDDSTSP